MLFIEQYRSHTISPLITVVTFDLVRQGLRINKMWIQNRDEVEMQTFHLHSLFWARVQTIVRRKRGFSLIYKKLNINDSVKMKTMTRKEVCAEYNIRLSSNMRFIADKKKLRVVSAKLLNKRLNYLRWKVLFCCLKSKTWMYFFAVSSLWFNYM